MAESRDILRNYISDMLAVEKHTLESVERQTRDDRVKKYREAYDILMRIESTLSSHQMALEQHLASIGGGGAESTIKKTATSAIGALSGLYGKFVREDPVSRSLRDHFTALNLAAISYTMLHTTALGVGDSAVADLALRHLHDLTPIIMSLNKVVPRIVLHELADEGKVVYTEAAEEAIDNTQKAWSGEAVEVS